MQTGLYGVRPSRKTWPHKYSGSTVSAPSKANVRNQSRLAIIKQKPWGQACHQGQSWWKRGDVDACAAQTNMQCWVHQDILFNDEHGREQNERNQGKQAHPVFKYRGPHGSHRTGFLTGPIGQRPGRSHHQLAQPCTTLGSSLAALIYPPSPLRSYSCLIPSVSGLIKTYKDQSSVSSAVASSASSSAVARL